MEPLVSKFVTALEQLQSPCPPWEQACSSSRLFVSSENTPLFDRVEIFTKDALKSCKQNTSTYASGVIGIGFRKQSTNLNIQSGSVIAYNTHAIKQQLNLSAQSQGIQITLKLSESKEITQGNTITFLEIRDAIGTLLYKIYWENEKLGCNIRIAGEQITCQGMKIGTEWQFTLPREALDQAKNGTLYIGNSADGSTPVLTPIRSIWLKRL